MSGEATAKLHQTVKRGIFRARVLEIIKERERACSHFVGAICRMFTKGFTPMKVNDVLPNLSPPVRIWIEFFDAVFVPPPERPRELARWLRS